MRHLDMVDYIKEKQKQAEERREEMQKKSQLREEIEERRRAEMEEKMKKMEKYEQIAYQEMMNEYYNWMPSMLQEVQFLETQSSFSKAFLYSYFEVLKMTNNSSHGDD